MKKFLSVVLSFLIILGLPVLSINAEEQNKPEAKTQETGQNRLDINAKSAILMEVNTGQILYEDNIDLVLPPASITKVMSLLLVVEALERGDFTLETVVNASEHACSMGGSQIWLEPNEAMTVDDLLKAAVIVSANDATVALGELVSGSEEGFVALMNERAKELGLKNTTFKNATGLDAEGHLTSAHDIAVMSSELIKHDIIKNYTTVWMDSLRNGESELVNTNRLIRFYSGATGLKTGTTSGSGYCLSATAERDGLELVAVVMGSDTTNDRFEGAKKLLDFGFANYNYQSIDADLKEEIFVEVEKGVVDRVKAVADDTLGAILKKSDKKEIKRETFIEKSVTAPIKKGDVLGHVEVYLGDELLGSIDIKADADVECITLKKALFWLIRALFVS